MGDQWIHKVFSVTPGDFERLALEIFRFQYHNNPVYKAYSDLLKTNPADIDRISAIPYLPIHFFKKHAIKTTDFEPAVIFESSGTTQTLNSRHFVKDVELYQQSFLRSFELFYGAPAEWCIIGLLPSYLDRQNSSLVFMVEQLVQQSQHSQSGFYLYDHAKLYRTLKELENERQKTLLIGVSFALLDLAEQYSLKLETTVLMETGGMKGRKKEMIRSELHEHLKRRFQLDVIHSEYGMTELLSQAYSRGNGIFHCPGWMKVLIRDEEDPLNVQSEVQSSMPSTGTAHHSPAPIRGAINVIDLANVYSCSFLATDDAGMLYGNGSFEVLGRIDNSDIRGCSLMAL